MYDYDNNGVLDRNDFECLAVRNTIMEGNGAWDDGKWVDIISEYQGIEISSLILIL